MYPILFTIYGVNIYTYGFFASLAFIAGYLSLEYLAKKSGLDIHNLIDKVFWVILAAIVGGRLSYFLLYHQQFEHWWQIFYTWQGGLTSFGGIFSALVIFSLLFKKNLWVWLDKLAVSFLIGLFFWRVGCALVGDHPVQISTAWFAINNQVPVIFLESLSGLLAFIAILIILNKFKFKNGLIFWIIFAYYGFIRIIIDHWRLDSHILLNLSSGQITGLLMLIVGLFAIFRMILYDKGK